MTSQDTIEVNADELSDEVLEGLVDEGELSESEAKEFAEDAHLDQIDIRDPVSKNIIESGKNKSAYVLDKLGWLYQVIADKTAHPEITDVTPKGNDAIDVKFSHPNHKRLKVRFGTDSVKLANLMAYHGVDSPRELEGKKVVFSEIKDARNKNDKSPINHRDSVISIPNNVSILGRARYMGFSLLQGVRSRTKVWTSGDGVDTFMFSALAYMVAFIVTLVFGGVGIELNEIGAISEPVLELMTLPFGLVLLAGVVSICWIISRIIMRVMYPILKGDFLEVHL